MSSQRGWIQTYTGRKVHPLAMTLADLDIQDIAYGLARTCRFGGQTYRGYYSVAEHSWLMSYCVPLDCALEALLHDAAEAYVGDMVRPMKHQPQMLEFRVAERRIEDLIIERFGLSSADDVWARVKEADDRILVDETQYLMRDPSMYMETELFQGLEPLGVYIWMFEPDVMAKRFLDRFAYLSR